MRSREVARADAFSVATLRPAVVPAWLRRLPDYSFLAPPSPPANLQPGAYYFGVSQGSNSVPVGTGTASMWICLSVGNPPTAGQVPVILTGEGGNYQARAVNGSLLLNITVSGSAASGSVQGNADDGSGFSMSVQEPAGVSGSITSDHAVGGTVVGNITLMGPHGYGGCSPTNWSLVAR